MSLVESESTASLARTFFSEGGRLRLSLTKRCNLSCTFCHREGGHDRKQMYLDAQTFARAANECFALGGAEVNLTGGEPTLFAGLTSLIDAIERPNGAVLSITTNGCDIGQLVRVKHKSAVTKLNVSMHGTDPEFLTSTISKKYDLDRVVQNVRALAQDYNVCLNFSLMKRNRDQLASVLDHAIDLGVDLKIINFQEIRWNEKKMTDEYVSPSQVFDLLAAHLKPRGITPERKNGGAVYGAQLDIFTAGVTVVTVVDGESWHQSMGACKGCRYAKICKEGFYAIRLYSDGTLAPCLHRGDLTIDFDPHHSLERNVNVLLRAVQ